MLCVADTIGLVVERERYSDWMDQLQWYCQSCHNITTQHKFHCNDLGSDLVPLIKSYYSDVEQRTCQSCGTIDQPPTKHDSDHILQIIQNNKSNDDSKESNDSVEQHDSSSAINNSTHPYPFLLQHWIDTHRHLLRPPVGNAMMYGTGAQFKIMIIGGPNIRTDYHIEAGEELFWQLQGDMILKINNGGTFQDIHINEGEMFLLPPYVPHSPQRGEGSIGLVIERERLSDEIDAIRWYCPNTQCRQILYTFSFYCADLGTQLKPLIQTWYSDEWSDKRVCQKCGSRDEKPTTTKLDRLQ